MSALSLMLQSSPSALPDAAPIEAQPLSDAAQAADVAAAVPANSLDLLDLVLKASIPVQLIMLLLVVASIASWVIIFRKAALLRRAKREAEQFEERFWSGAELGKLYEGASSRGRDVGGMEAIFEAGFRDFNR
ncbi:MAG TPA: protein TolQ, partial [Lysobacter sp.]|nr:protein TolQ [Lysobacter sp.]